MLGGSRGHAAQDNKKGYLQVLTIGQQAPRNTVPLPRSPRTITPLP